MNASSPNEPEGVDPLDTPEAEEIRGEGICLHIFTTSAAMVGVCLTVLSFFRLLVRQGDIQTAGDDILGWNALAFLVACFAAYFALRTRSRKKRLRLERIADGIFLLALSLMGIVCLLLVYEIAHQSPN